MINKKFNFVEILYQYNNIIETKNNINEKPRKIKNSKDVSISNSSENGEEIIEVLKNLKLSENT